MYKNVVKTLNRLCGSLATWAEFCKCLSPGM